MNRLLIALVWIGTSLFGMGALSPQQIKELEEAKKQFADGLITQPIYEEIQRKILSLPAPAKPPPPAETPSRPTAPGAPAAASPMVPAPTKSEAPLLHELTAGYWVIFHPETAETANTYLFSRKDGKLRLTRFKRNDADEPGRGEDAELSDVTLEPNRIEFSFLMNPEGKDRTSMELKLTADGRLEPTETALLNNIYIKRAIVKKGVEWDAFVRDNGAQRLLEVLGPAQELWGFDGKPVRELTSDSIAFWYNAVNVPRTFDDDWGPTLRPLVVKIRKVGTGFKVTERFDHMGDFWVPFPLPGLFGQEQSLKELIGERFAKGEMSEVDWQESAKKLPKRSGNSAEKPIKDGGIRRGKYNP